MRSALLVSFALLACSRASGEPKPHGPIVVELFTSQGCSSCPPADRLLGQLAADDRIAPLSFHVDYWDELGWPDPYAKPAWTQRQRVYARALGDDRVYTPELVVGGTVGMVGSNRSQVTAAIANAAPPAPLAATSAWKNGRLELTTTAPEGADVWVAIYERQVSTRVPRGENAGETLASTHVVRTLERVAAAGKRGTLSLAIDPRWKDVGAIAFAQRADRTIVASAVLR